MAEPTIKPGAMDELKSGLAECWRNLPDKGLFFGLLAVWTALFHWFGNSTFGFFKTPSLFGWMYRDYTSSEDDYHGLFVPAAVLVLLYLKRKEWLPLPKRLWWPAAALFLFAAVCHLAGFMIQQTRVSILAYFLGVYALTGAVWGWRYLRATFFPMFLFVFCVPMATMADELTLPLRQVVSSITVFICHNILGVAVVKDGVQIFSPNGTFHYEVAAACSGIRSLTALLALTTIFGFMSFKSTWRRLLMVVSAAPLAVFGNVARLVTVVIVAETFGQQAGAAVESKLGFLTFLTAIVFIMVMDRWLDERKPPRAPALEEKSA